MTFWFGNLFEDPSESMPHISAEGGFQYIWGGPYDAAEELGGEFGGIVSDERIEQAVEEVQSEGIYDWAPSSNHPDREMMEDEARDEDRPDDFDEPDKLASLIRRLENGAETEFGDEGEIDRRRAVLARLEALRILLEAAAPRHGGVGHNNPPPDEEIDTRAVAELRRLQETIRAELEKPRPEAIVVAKSASNMRLALGWVGKKIDTTVDAFAKGFGGALGKSAAAGVALWVSTQIPGVGEVVQGLLGDVTAWLTHVIRAPF